MTIISTLTLVRTHHRDDLDHIIDDQMTIIISTLRASNYQLQQVTVSDQVRRNRLLGWIPKSIGRAYSVLSCHRVADIILSLPAVTQRFQRAYPYIVFQDSFLDDLPLKYKVFYDADVFGNC